jgi:hypothetical protein
MNRTLIPLTAAVTALSLGALASVALAQQEPAAAKQRAGSSWLQLSEFVARLEGCGSYVGDPNAKGLLTFTTANGLSRMQYLTLPAENLRHSKSAELSAGQAAVTEPLALLSAYVVRPDGSTDPVYGSQPKDMVILTTGDGRVIVTFTDFAADSEAGTYLYPGKVDAPMSQLTDALR